MSSSPLYRPFVDSGELIAVSGQIGIAEGQLADGIEAQSDQALSNLRAVLASAGLTPSDVVKVNIYLTTMEHYDALNTAYAAAFPTEPPARTCVAVNELPFGALVELEAWARRH